MDEIEKLVFHDQLIMQLMVEYVLSRRSICEVQTVHN